MHDGVHQQTLRVDENVALLALDFLACIIAVRVNLRPPFLGAFNALAVNDCSGWAGLAAHLFATFDVKRMMDAIERSIPTPQIEIVVHRRAWRQILRDRAPLAAGAQDVHQPVDDFPYVDMASIAAAFGRQYQWLDMRPFLVRKVTWIAQLAAVITRAIFK
jgi:hypothetical protein